MYSMENYFWGLVAYSLAAVGLMLCCWRFRTLIAWKHPRNLLLLMFAVILFVPVSVTPELNFLAPAWLVSIFDGLTSSPGGYARAGIPLLICCLVAWVLYIPASIYCSKRRRASSQSSEAPT